MSRNGFRKRWRGALFLLALGCAVAFSTAAARAQDPPAAEQPADAAPIPEETPFWGEVYAESVSSGYEGSNIVTDLFVKQGVGSCNRFGETMEGYLKARAYYDREGHFWNNRGEFGGGVRWRPSAAPGLVVFIDLLYGIYSGREKTLDPNPDDDPYWDIQGGAAFWGWWGRQPDDGQGNAFFLPFTGWRELYADAIYYDHSGRDVIATWDFKEGLGLGRIGPMIVDAYLTAEGSRDTNGDEWSNYLRAGPGIRLTPFAALDCKISLEYLWNRYDRGGYEGVDPSSSGLVVTAVFWHGW
jgi:hypothetical protein